jgi:hypothetical protein
MMTGERTVLRIGGKDRGAFLHGLVTHDVGEPGTAPVYSALLTPQGKYLADFFLLNRGDDILLDVNADAASGLAQRLAMYRLRADVTIDDSGLTVGQGLADMPDGAWPDPRHPALGWRGYDMTGDVTEWDALRVAHCIPETGVELIPNDTFILEAGFDRLNGVNHRKGCYVGQEVTARMRHKTVLRKGLVTVDVQGAAPVGTEIMAGEKPAGVLYTQAGGRAMAYLRFDRAGSAMTAGDALVTWQGQD